MITRLKKALPQSKPLVLIILFGFAISIQAQTFDKFYLNDGNMIKCKIAEIGAEKIKYKLPGNIDGPMYLIRKSRALMVNFEDGSFVSFVGPNAGKRTWPDDTLHKIILRNNTIIRATKVIIDELSEVVHYESRMSPGVRRGLKKDDVLCIFYPNKPAEIISNFMEAAYGLSYIQADFGKDEPNQQMAFPAIDTSLTRANETIDVDNYTVRAKQRVGDLGEMIRLIPNASDDEVDKYIDFAVDLFVNENAAVVVSSTSRKKDDLYKIRNYLDRLTMLTNSRYDSVAIEWSNIQYVIDLKPGPNGDYYGLISFEQKFSGYRDSRVLYGDITTKNIQIVVKKRLKIEGAQIREFWDVFLSDIGVSETRKS